MKLFFVLFILIFGVQAQAFFLDEGVGLRGGGDEAGLEFLTALKLTLSDIEKFDPGLHGLLVSAGVPRIADQLKVVVVDHPLKLKVKGVVQESIAVNEPQQQRILLHRQRWSALTDERIRRGIVLHEVLGLAGLESTGVYLYSARYLSKFGLTYEALAGQPSTNRNYVNCVDVNKGLLSLSIDSDQVLQYEAQALTSKNAESLRKIASDLGVSAPLQVSGVSFQLDLKKNQNRTYCQFDFYNWRLFSCSSDRIFWTLDSQVKLIFNRRDGSSEALQVGQVDLNGIGLLEGSYVFRLNVYEVGLSRLNGISLKFPASSCD